MVQAENCEGNCTDVQAIRDHPTENFIQKLERESGKTVSITGFYGFNSGQYPPDFTVFAEGGAADERLVSRAWYDAEHAKQLKQERIAELCADCPGILDATVETDFGTAVIPVCGKLVMRVASDKPE